MKLRIQVPYTLTMAAAVALWLGGCAGDDESASPAGETHSEGESHEEAGHTDGDHEEAGHGEHKEGENAEKHAHAEGHGHSDEEMKAQVAKLTSYSEAMHEIGESREKIEHLIESGKLTDVHPPAEMISLIARRLATSLTF